MCIEGQSQWIRWLTSINVVIKSTERLTTQNKTNSRVERLLPAQPFANTPKKMKINEQNSSVPGGKFQSLNLLLSGVATASKLSEGDDTVLPSPS